MKNIFKISRIPGLVLISTFTLFSCHDKLDTREGQLNVDDVDYTNTEAMIEPLIGAYNALYTRGWEETLLLGVRGDDVNAGGLGDQQPYADTDMYNYDRNYWMYNSLWNLQYSDIISTNTAIQQVMRFQEFADEDGLDRGDRYIAEIKVMRAWLHLNLARTWKDVFIITSNQPTEEIEAGVSSKAEVMQWISDQMDEAIPLLQNLRPNEKTDLPGGITKYTAYAIKALAQQELGNYQEVAQATDAIIGSGRFNLYPDFYSLFKKPGELSNESLLEFQYSDYDQPNGDEFYYLYDPYGPQNWTPARAEASSGWGFYEPSFKWIKFMLDRNETVRLETSVLFTDRGINQLQDENYTNLPGFVKNITRDGDVINDFERAYFSSGKHYLPSNQLTPKHNAYGAGKNLIIIRYAEILLMHAEAVTRGASSSTISADQAVNMVRNRANMASISNVTTEQVLQEKYAELALELGKRFYDMIRTNEFNELSYDGRTFSASDVYLPYPQAQVDALPLEATDVDTDTEMNASLNNLN